MSFLLDPPFLILIGVAIAFLADRGFLKILKKSTLVLSTITVTLFWAIGGLLYLDFLDIPWLGEAGSGRHFMWNSGIELVGLTPPINVVGTYTNPFCALNIVAILLFATYPIFLKLGVFAGIRIFSKAHRHLI